MLSQGAPPGIFALCQGSNAGRTVPALSRPSLPSQFRCSPGGKTQAPTLPVRTSSSQEEGPPGGELQRGGRWWTIGEALERPRSVSGGGGGRRAQGPRRHYVTGSPTGVCQVHGECLRIPVGAPRLWLLLAPRLKGPPSPPTAWLHLSSPFQGRFPCQVHRLPQRPQEGGEEPETGG